MMPVRCETSLAYAMQSLQVELIGRLDQNARHVEGDVADANYNGAARGGDQLVDLRRHEMIIGAGLIGVGMYVGMAAIPGHELGRGHASLQLLAGNLKPSVTARAVCVDDRVDRLPELGKAQVGANGYIAVEPDRWLLQSALEGVADRSNGLMVWRNAVADQSERHR